MEMVLEVGVPEAEVTVLKSLGPKILSRAEEEEWSGRERRRGVKR